MSGYLVRNSRGSYLEWTPYDGAIGWLAGSQEYATVFTEGAALELADTFNEPVDVTPDDYYKREPKFDADDICLRHRRIKPMSEYGIRYGGCADCEPPEPDYDAACAIAARRDPTHPDNVEMRRLKR